MKLARVRWLEPRREWWCLSPVVLVLLGTGLAVRLVWVSLHPMEPVSDFAAYHDHAVTLVEHAVYSGTPDHPSAYRPPGWPLFLAVLYLVVGTHWQLGVLAGVWLEWAAMVLAATAAGRLLRPRFAAGAVGGMAFYPGAVAFSPILASEHLAVLLFTGVVVLVAFARPAIPTALAAGLLTGALTLARPDYGVPVALVLGAWLLRVTPVRRAATLAAVMVAGGLICVGPWTARNAIVFGEFIPVSTNGGTSFYLGTLAPGWTESAVVERLGPSSVHRPRAHENRYWRLGLDNVARDPLRWVGLGVERIPYQYGQEELLFWWGGIEPPLRAAGRVYWLVIVMLAVAGLGTVVLQRRRLPFAWSVIAGSIVAVSVLKLAFIVSQRDRLPLTYLLIVLAGLGAQRLADLARWRAVDGSARSLIPARRA